MKKYHFLFKINDILKRTVGETFQAKDVFIAMVDFDKKYPEATFLCVYDLEEMSALLKHQLEFAEKFKFSTHQHEEEKNTVLRELQEKNNISNMPDREVPKIL